MPPPRLSPELPIELPIEEIERTTARHLTYDLGTVEVFLGGRPIVGSAAALEHELRAAIDATLDMHRPLGVAGPSREVIDAVVRTIVESMRGPKIEHIETTVGLVEEPPDVDLHEMLVGDAVLF